MNLEWLGFWIFLSVLVYCDYTLFEKGYDTLLFTHKTQIEKEIQAAKLKKIKEES